MTLVITSSHAKGSIKSDLNQLHSLVVPGPSKNGQISVLGSSVVALMASGIKVIANTSNPTD